jgi:hypothetical protein
MRSTAFRASLLTLGLTAFHLACGEDEAEKQRKQAIQQEQAAEDEFAKTYCEIVNECCNRTLQLPKDVDACKKRLLATDPVTIKDAQARTGCIDQLKANRLRFDFCSDFGNMELASCPDRHRKELTGTKKVGESCAASSECAPSYEGVVSCKGVCQLVRHGKDGQAPCIATIDGTIETPVNDVKDAEAVNCYTRDGLVCDPGSKKCIAPFAAEKPCSDTRQCAAGLFCEEREKQCFARIETGKSCTQIDECKGYCKDFSAEAIGKCIAPSAQGSTCSKEIP